MKNTSGQENTVQVGKSGSEMAQRKITAPLFKKGKNHPDYWKERLFKRTYTTNDKTVEINVWQVRIAHLGHREFFSLGTSNQTAASTKARDIYEFLRANGWEKTLESYKPKSASTGSDIATVGDLLDIIKASTPDLSPTTYEIYASKFRSLVAGVFGFKCDKGEKSDYVNGGSARWAERIRKVKLERLTAERIQAYKVRYLKAASSDPVTLKHAQTTLHSQIGNAKALFSPKIQQQIGKTVPNPFKEVGNVTLPKSRYKSEFKNGFTPELLLMQAQRELMTPSPEEPASIVSKPVQSKQRKPTRPGAEEFKVLILALGCGLRRDEIDTLTWSQIDFTGNQIRIETNEHTTAKSDESENVVDVDPGLIEILREFMAKSQSQFVINSLNAPKPNATTYHHYRCGKVFARLLTWLRSKGVNARNGIHSLRKEYGSQICSQAGIYVASAALRHANIALTASYYLDKKKAVFYNVSKALTGTKESQDNPVPDAPAAASA